MIVATYDGGVRIELETDEARALADFLDQEYEGYATALYALAQRLDDALQIER